MQKKLSSKEREETVTKGFLEDHLEYMLNKNGYVTDEFLMRYGYATKAYFEEILEGRKYVTKDFLESKNYVAQDHLIRKNYATKEYTHDMFETFEKSIEQKIEESFGQHIRALMEENKHYFQAIIETLSGRFERNEAHLDNHDRRLNHLELRTCL